MYFYPFFSLLLRRIMMTLSAITFVWVATYVFDTSTDLTSIPYTVALFTR